MSEWKRPGVLAVAGLFALLIGRAIGAETDDPPPWRETSRDVYVDGRLDSGAIVLRASDPAALAVLRDRTETTAIMIEPESLELRRIAIDELTFGERGWEARTKGKPRGIPKGAASRIDDSTLLVVLPEGYLIIASHAGVRGPTSRDEIFSRMPSWKELYERHDPDATAVRALGAIQEDVQLTLAIGTWCGDSKREVPRLLKALDLAGNSHIELQVVGLSGDFDEPVELIRDRRLTNVPTLVVSRDGEEIGRVVETPAGESMAADLVRILTREPLLNEGRWSRSELLARGRYSVQDASGIERGIEDWELFSDDEGGTLLHALADSMGRATEVWHRRDAEGRSSFIEITRTAGPWHSRSRHWIRVSDDAGRKLSSLTRGNGTGVIRQNAILEDGAVIVSPCVADAGHVAALAASAQGPATRAAILLGGAGDAATGRLGSLTLSHRSAQSVTTAAGTFLAHRVGGRLNEDFVDGWLHDGLGVPVRWQRSGGEQALLTELETFTPTVSEPESD